MKTHFESLMIAFWMAKVKIERTSAYRKAKKENPSVFASTEGLCKTRMEWEKFVWVMVVFRGIGSGPVENVAVWN